MKTTLQLLRTVLISFGIPLLWQQAVPECQAQTTPYYPPATIVTISPQPDVGDVTVAVSVALPDACHYLGDWGQPTFVGQNVYVDTQFWVKTGVECAQVITTVSNKYDLGTLPPGDYTFVFQAWGRTIKTQTFTVPGSIPPCLSIFQLGGTTARLVWPTNATDYTLEYATALPAEQWTTVTNNYSAIGDAFILDVDLTVPQMFFRLHKP